jgi:hypothetical protein
MGRTCFQHSKLEQLSFRRHVPSTSTRSTTLCRDGKGSVGGDVRGPEGGYILFPLYPAGPNFRSPFRSRNHRVTPDLIPGDINGTAGHFQTAVIRSQTAYFPSNTRFFSLSAPARPNFRPPFQPRNYRVTPDLTSGDVNGTAGPL